MRNSTQNKFSPSVQIERDLNSGIQYIPTPNAHRVYEQILEDYQKGIHTFNIIGSYGTGKSSFVVAFLESISGFKKHFHSTNGYINDVKSFKFINIVGQYASLQNIFASKFKTTNKDVLYTINNVSERLTKEKKCLVITIDEFGKFLEYATKHEPERELYFLQQLAEIVNTQDKNVFLITILHQGFETYGRKLETVQKQEWEKVRGRLKDIPFNEPVEQLLLLAAKRLRGNKSFLKNIDRQKFDRFIDACSTAKLFSFNKSTLPEFVFDLYPLDIISAFILSNALKKYGQNERSLFTFLESSDYLGINDSNVHLKPYFNVSHVYNYFIHNFYTFLHTRDNPDYLQWSSIRRAIERTEGECATDIEQAIEIVKIIGLLNIFSSESGDIDDKFLESYAHHCLDISKTTTRQIIEQLKKRKIIRFLNYKSRYILFDGTDMDIELEIQKAENKIDPIKNVAVELQKLFQFDIALAKRNYFEIGTPRYFQYVISEKPILDPPSREIDGFINIIISSKVKKVDIIKASEQCEEAIIYACYSNVEEISRLLLEIRKILFVLKSVEDDKVARRELSKLLDYHSAELRSIVFEGLFNDENKIEWYFAGKRIEINNSDDLNSRLSRVCDKIYYGTPTFKSELVNRSKLSGSIASARRNLFKALCENSSKEDLGFRKDKFPPEKTIYLSLLKQTRIHTYDENIYFLSSPSDNSFLFLTQCCEEYLRSSVNNKKPISELIDILSQKPYKLKYGFIEFWLPIFLLSKKDSFALYNENVFVPSFNEDVLELILKNPNKYSVKTFDLNLDRIELLNRYRSFLSQSRAERISSISLVQTMVPFISFYRGLQECTKRTKRLSKQTLALRDAIANAKDLETTFFEDFPRALGYSNFNLKDTDYSLDEYFDQLQQCICELRESYDELLDYYEKIIKDALGCSELDFPFYRETIKKRFSSLKMYLLLPYQKTFCIRLFSDLDDKNAWISSIVQSVIGKPADQIWDQEIELVTDRLQTYLQELDNLCDIHKLEYDEEKEEIVKIEITSNGTGTKKKLVRIPMMKMKESDSIESSIKSSLSSNKSINLFVLSKLIKEHFTDEES